MYSQACLNDHLSTKTSIYQKRPEWNSFLSGVCQTTTFLGPEGVVVHRCGCICIIFFIYYFWEALYLFVKIISQKAINQFEAFISSSNQNHFCSFFILKTISETTSTHRLETVINSTKFKYLLDTNSPSLNYPNLS